MGEGVEELHPTPSRWQKLGQLGEAGSEHFAFVCFMARFLPYFCLGSTLLEIAAEKCFCKIWRGVFLLGVRVMLFVKGFGEMFIEVRLRLAFYANVTSICM